MRPEIESLEAFDAHLRSEQTLAGCVIQSLDLRGRGEVLSRTPVHNAFFLGCRLKHKVASDLAGRGASIFPRLPHLPFNAYPNHMYAPEELYDELEVGYAFTLDAKVYEWTRGRRSGLLDATLAQALHDHFISDALLDDMGPDVSCIGIMGGHNIGRDTAEFLDTAKLAHGLAEHGHRVLTGGGPGAMEAANLGASFRDELEELAAACNLLSELPSFAPDASQWAASGFRVKKQWDCTRQTIGIPTWFYGHEPPNVFATHIAKYFDNAIREDTLLRLATGGLVFVPGRAGTTQEIFQALTRNYYAIEAQELRPMVLVGTDYWTNQVPAWPLLQALAKGRMMEPHIRLVDTLDEVLAILKD